jgi:hypothetical protein
MSKLEFGLTLVDTLAAIDIQELAEILQTSERSIRRWTSEGTLFRRDDGRFPICTTAAWWLADHQRRVAPGGNPDIDLALLVIKFLGWLEFHTFNEAMLSTAEYLIRVPVTENDFKVAKTLFTARSLQGRMSFLTIGARVLRCSAPAPGGTALARPRRCTRPRARGCAGRRYSERIRRLQGKDV